MKVPSSRCVALLCTVACATVTIGAVWPTDRNVRTEDRNADGRPDVWRRYDQSGQLAEVAIDTNFDGRSDIQEYYDRGGLIRRESDRNFDDRVDLIEEFDGATHQQIKSVVDLDYDGTADLLVLFRDGRPVFAERASARAIRLPQRDAVAARESSGVRPSGDAGDTDNEHRAPLERLTRLVDPFGARTAVQPTRTAAASSGECVGPCTPDG